MGRSLAHQIGTTIYQVTPLGSSAPGQLLAPRLIGALIVGNTTRRTRCYFEPGPKAPPAIADIIAGQHTSNLLIVLEEFRSGERTSDVMGPIAKDLSRDDMKALAAYFSALPWPAYREPADAASITRVHAFDVEMHCTSCHREGFVG